MRENKKEKEKKEGRGREGREEERRRKEGKLKTSKVLSTGLIFYNSRRYEKASCHSLAWKYPESSECWTEAISLLQRDLLLAPGSWDVMLRTGWGGRLVWWTELEPDGSGLGCCLGIPRKTSLGSLL